MSTVLMPTGGAEAAELIIEIMDKHMSEEDRLPVAMCLAFSDQRVLIKAFQQLLANQVLTTGEVVERLKQVPALVKSLELAS